MRSSVSMVLATGASPLLLATPAHAQMKFRDDADSGVNPGGALG